MLASKWFRVEIIKLAIDKLCKFNEKCIQKCVLVLIIKLIDKEEAIDNLDAAF